MTNKMMDNCDSYMIEEVKYARKERDETDAESDEKLTYTTEEKLMRPQGEDPEG